MLKRALSKLDGWLNMVLRATLSLFAATPLRDWDFILYACALSADFSSSSESAFCRSPGSRGFLNPAPLVAREAIVRAASRFLVSRPRRVTF